MLAAGGERLTDAGSDRIGENEGGVARRHGGRAGRDRGRVGAQERSRPAVEGQHGEHVGCAGARIGGTEEGRVQVCRAEHVLEERHGAVRCDRAEGHIGSREVGRGCRIVGDGVDDRARSLDLLTRGVEQADGPKDPRSKVRRGDRVEDQLRRRHAGCGDIPGRRGRHTGGPGRCADY